MARPLATILTAALVLPLLGAALSWRMEPAAEALPIDSAVTADTLAETICRPAWTKTRRPCSSVMARIKLALLAARGEPAEARALYILDHEIPLQLGGAGREPRNLSLNLRADEKLKDRIEAKLKCLVCQSSAPIDRLSRVIKFRWIPL